MIILYYIYLYQVKLPPYFLNCVIEPLFVFVGSINHYIDFDVQFIWYLQMEEAHELRHLE